MSDSFLDFSSSWHGYLTGGLEYSHIISSFVVACGLLPRYTLLYNNINEDTGVTCTPKRALLSQVKPRYRFTRRIPALLEFEIPSIMTNRKRSINFAIKVGERQIRSFKI